LPHFSCQPIREFAFLLDFSLSVCTQRSSVCVPLLVVVFYSCADLCTLQLKLAGTNAARPTFPGFLAHCCWTLCSHCSCILPYNVYSRAMRATLHPLAVLLCRCLGMPKTTLCSVCLRSVLSFLSLLCSVLFCVRVCCVLLLCCTRSVFCVLLCLCLQFPVCCVLCAVCCVLCAVCCVLCCVLCAVFFVVYCAVRCAVLCDVL
jgi:hypothetical protein